MTSGNGKESQSGTPDMASEYKEAEPFKEAELPTTCSSSVEVGEIPIKNTVFARSSAETREVIVEPVRIRKSLESLERNRHLQAKGLG